MPIFGQADRSGSTRPNRFGLGLVGHIRKVKSGLFLALGVDVIGDLGAMLI